MSTWANESGLLFLALNGALLGLQAGLAPGPVLTLILAESIRHGRRAGMKLALVPLLTDWPIIAVVVPLLYYLTFDATAIIGVISMVGALFLCYLGYESVSVTRDQFVRGDAPRISLPRAVAVNFFNPNLYIYWIGICGPICVTALRNFGGPGLAVFLIAFYVSITLGKIGVSLAVGSVRQSLNVRMILWVNRLLGVMMWGFALLFFWQGYQLFTQETTVRAEPKM